MDLEQQSFLYSLINDYSNLFSEEELRQIKIAITTGKNLPEELLLLFAKRTWDYVINDSSYYFVSWLKEDVYNQDKKLIHMTFFKENDVKNFCDMKYGIRFKVDYEGMLCALNHDAAVVIVKYPYQKVLAYDGDNYICSINKASRIVTPKQVLNDCADYNEVVFFRQYCTPIEVVCYNIGESGYLKAKYFAHLLGLNLKRLEKNNLDKKF